MSSSFGEAVGKAAEGAKSLLTCLVWTIISLVLALLIAIGIIVYLWVNTP